MYIHWQLGVTLKEYLERSAPRPDCRPQPESEKCKENCCYEIVRVTTSDVRCDSNLKFSLVTI
jgi:hypothetical protein